jgi:hypothetical protein
VVQWSNKNGTPLPQVSFEYDNQWLGQGVCFDAAATSKSCVMVNVPKIVQKHIRDNKKQGIHTVEVKQKPTNDHTWYGEGWVLKDWPW